MSRRLLISCRNFPELPGLSEESPAKRSDQPDEIAMPSASHGIDLQAQSATRTTDGMIFAPFCPTPRTNRKKRLGQRALEIRQGETGAAVFGRRSGPGAKIDLDQRPALHPVTACRPRRRVEQTHEQPLGSGTRTTHRDRFVCQQIARCRRGAGRVHDLLSARPPRQVRRGTVLRSSPIPRRYFP